MMTHPQLRTSRRRDGPSGEATVANTLIQHCYSLRDAGADDCQAGNLSKVGEDIKEMRRQMTINADTAKVFWNCEDR